METVDRESDIKKWLTVALAQENLDTFSVTITGNSEKGDGYAGDIIFVTVKGTKAGKNKQYDLVLKCTKSSVALLEKLPAIRKAFVREGYLYQSVFPLVKQLQINKGIRKPFDSVPKCYGVYCDDFRYVIVLENLKTLGYDLWPKGKPLTREVINIVIKDYAKFHATSVALKEQDPEKFQKFLEETNDDIFKEFFKSSDFLTSFKNVVEEVYEMLIDDVKNDILQKWLTLKEQVSFIFLEMTPSDEELQVITHGDCWVNNFLFKFENEEKTVVSKVAILDWQLSKYTSPVLDLSYYLFAGISQEDIADMDTILRDYYKYFCEYLTRMGSNFANKYTLENFFDEWKKYGKFGALMCIMPIKSLYTEKEDLPDMAEAADSGAEMSESFTFIIRDKTEFKSRMKPLVKYAVENGLI